MVRKTKEDKKLDESIDQLGKEIKRIKNSRIKGRAANPLSIALGMLVIGDINDMAQELSRREQHQPTPEPSAR